MIDAQDLATLVDARRILAELADSNYRTALGGQAAIGRDVVFHIILTLKYQHGEPVTDEMIYGHSVKA